MFIHKIFSNEATNEEIQILNSPWTDFNLSLKKTRLFACLYYLFYIQNGIDLLYCSIVHQQRILYQKYSAGCAIIIFNICIIVEFKSRSDLSTETCLNIKLDFKIDGCLKILFVFNVISKILTTSINKRLFQTRKESHFYARRTAMYLILSKQK